MKKFLLSSTFAVAFGLFVACGDDSGSNSGVASSDSKTAEDGSLDAESYESEEDMPNCTATRAGDIAEVEGEYFLCVPKKWRPLEGSVSSECGLPACDDDLEEAYFYASSAETYFQCVEGEWLDADGESLGAGIADKCLRDSLAETAVKSEEDLPNCTAKRKGTMFLVGDEITLCDGEDWVLMDDVESSASKAKSSASAPKSSASEEESSDDGDDPEEKSSSSKAKSSSSAAPKSSSSTSKSSSSAAKPTMDEDAMTMTDNSTGRTYNLKNIDGILWITTNLITGTESGDGVYCVENDGGDNVCEKYGTFYDYETAQTACPSGWRLPTLEETEAAWDKPTEESWQWIPAGRFKISGDDAEYGKEGDEGRIWVADMGDDGAFQFGGDWKGQLNEPNRGHNVRCVTESSAMPGSSATASSSSVSPIGPVQGVCATTSPIEKGDSAKWSFTPMAGAKVETYNWEFSDGTTSTDASPIRIYDKAGNYTAKVTINKGTDSESTTECSGLMVKGTPISGCTCEFSSGTVASLDLAVANPAVAYWTVSGCENADGSTEFEYKWGDGIDSETAEGVATFTKIAKMFTPSVTITNADGMSMTATCPTVDVIDSDNPEEVYVIEEAMQRIELPAGTSVVIMNLPDDWHNLDEECTLSCMPHSHELTVSVGGVSVGPSWYTSLTIPVSSTKNGYRLEITLDTPAKCEIQW